MGWWSESKEEGELKEVSSKELSLFAENDKLKKENDKLKKENDLLRLQLAKRK